MLRWERNLRESGTSWRAVLGKRKVGGRGEGIQLRVSFAPLLRFFSKDARIKFPFN